jgi:H+-transporting ATPase
LKLKGTSEYQKLSVPETLQVLETRMTGLTEDEAKRRIVTFGHNEIVEKKKNPLRVFLSRFWGPMPWLLETAIVLAAFLGHALEALIILLLLATNAVIGFLNERSSHRALELLKQKLAIQARVLRNEKWIVKEARDIAPGDVIAVGLGDLVPADAKIVSGMVSVDQSALTGESMPIDAVQSSMIYSGSVARHGEAKSVVVNTGVNTYFGKTAELVKIAKPKSHQEEVMLAVVKYMMYVGIVALALVSVYGLIMNVDVLSLLTFAVVFLMGAVPVALPAVLTIVQAVGAMELAKKKVLVTKLDSIEDAASVDFLCLDKTGTITQNKLSVVDIEPLSHHSKEDVILMAGLASKEESKDLIDLAVIKQAEIMGINFGTYKVISFTPFDPSLKRTEAIVEVKGKQFQVVKGAPQVVLSLCRGIDEETQTETLKSVEEFSEKGYRTLAIAKSEENNLEILHLVGLLSLADPPRPDSKSMIEEIRKEGIKPIMLTGDNLAIAKEIAQQVSIGDKITRITDLKGLSETEQAKTVEENDGFAEIYPEDKYKTVKLLQSRGHMVGMTGDGVNDAPALKQAEMGIAVSNSTDVAKAAASVVLIEPGVKVIIDAVKTSRQIYQRMLTWVLNKITKTIQFIGLLTIGFVWLQSDVISLLGMSLLIFANDFVTISLATDNVKHTSNPNKWNVKNITFASIVLGLCLVAEGAVTIFIGLNLFQLEFEQLRTFILLMLIFTSQFRVYIVRERRFFWSSRPGRGLLLSTTATIAGFVLLGIYGVIIPAILLYQVLFVLVLSALFVFTLDPLKYYTFKKFGL